MLVGLAPHSRGNGGFFSLFFNFFFFAVGDTMIERVLHFCGPLAGGVSPKKLDDLEHASHYR